MKRIPLIASILVIASVLVTAAFTRPLASRNGVVVSYTPGKSLVLHSDGVDMTYIVRGTTFANVQGLGTGARVTVWATCLGGANSAANMALRQSIASLQTKFGVSNGQTGANGQFGNSNPAFNKAMHNLVEGNANPCIAVFIKVRSAAKGVPATGGTGGAAASATSTGTSAASSSTSAATTAAPSAAVSSTPAASATSSGSTGGAAGATSATATMTATPCPTQATVGAGTPTATPDVTMMCGTPTPTSTP